MAKNITAMNNRFTDSEINDFYATNPISIDKLLKFENFNNNIWECACGQGHLSRRLEFFGFKVKSTDLINRGYGIPNVDFLNQVSNFDGDIITNPPYKYSIEFVEKALELTDNKVAMFLKLTFLESQKRKVFFEKYPPKKIYVFSERILCAKDGNFENYKSSPVAYCWYIWEKGYKGDTIIKWI